MGLINMGARYYDPTVGRFISADPYGHGGSMDLYSYANGNPVFYCDPDGRYASALLEKTTNGQLLDHIQQGLDVAGMMPVIGVHPVVAAATTIINSGADLLNAGISAARGHYFDAAANMMGILPGAGDKAKLYMKATDKMGISAEIYDAKTVIGRVKDLKNLLKREKSLLDKLPDMGNPKSNWKQNSGVLRQEMKKNFPIGDKSPGDTGGVFLNAERALLKERGWSFDPTKSQWIPPR
jgi:uncharacterized protein RhaS with RHS repeats